MKERLITLLCAIGALALFAIMFLNRESVTSGLEAPRPITSERRGNGYNAAMTWLENERIRTVSLRDRYSTLTTRSDLTRTGNLLIVTGKTFGITNPQVVTRDEAAEHVASGTRRVFGRLPFEQAVLFSKTS